MIIRIVLFLVFLFFTSSLVAQFSGHNLLEYQYGKLPSDTVDNFSTLYDRFVVDYTLKKFKAGITLEQYYTPYEERNYIRIDQARLQYFSKNLEVKLGNFYETIGRGILLRSYEISGAVIEDLSYRSRHYFNRDVVGAMVKYRSKKFSTKVLSGYPLNNVFPPNQDLGNRRPNRMDAIYSDYIIKGQTLGGAFMNLDQSTDNKQYAMITASGNILPFLSYYTEMARNVGDNSLVDFSQESEYALYVNANAYIGDLGITAEYKNYKNFVLGAGINEPPALVKEHTYQVLNRSTHVLNPLDESGYQLEFYYNLPDYSLLTFNHTRAVNEFGKKFVFQEYFLEYSATIFKKHDMKIFFDYAEDPFKLENNRISTGGYFEWVIKKKSAINTDYEFQIFEREGNSVQNHYLLIGYSFTSKIIADVVAEYSTDPFLTDNGSRYWIGGHFRYKLNNKHTVLLFGGKRRGGPACNAGVCYEVLDFEGIEIRITSRL